MNIYEISKELAEIEYELTELGGEIPDGPEGEALLERLDNVLSLETEKVDAYCALIKNLEARAKARNEEAKRMASLASAEENAAKRLKSRLQAHFKIHGKDGMETLRFKLAIQKNGGKIPVIVSPEAEANPEELPEQFRKVVFSVNRDALLEALQLPEGDETRMSAEQFAQLGERGEHLRIR